MNIVACVVIACWAVAFAQAGRGSSAGATFVSFALVVSSLWLALAELV